MSQGSIEWQRGYYYCLLSGTKLPTFRIQEKKSTLIGKKRVKEKKELHKTYINVG